MLRIFLIATILKAVLMTGVPGCPHPIFCDQNILAAVAKSNYYPDSKSFVDAILTVPIDKAQKDFQILPIT